jgi:putative transposase
VREVYGAIAQLESSYSLASLCDTLQVSRSGYYSWQQGQDTERQRADYQLMPLIRGIFWEHKRRYGARRIVRDLAARGETCGTRRVGRLMREMGLRAIQPRSYRPRTTDSRHTLGYNPNLLLDAPPPGGINRTWVGDITYIPLVDHDFLYLALLMDLYSRRIVGWNLADHLREPLVLQALRQAITLRNPASGLIHHTDRGGQYAGKKYRQVLDRAGMAQSMSRADNCYDNAFMESCFGTIKLELEMKAYEDERLARHEISEYLRYYNTRRRHSALHYLTPEEFERLHE